MKQARERERVIDSMLNANERNGALPQKYKTLDKHNKSYWDDIYNACIATLTDSLLVETIQKIKQGCKSIASYPEAQSERVLDSLSLIELLCNEALTQPDNTGDEWSGHDQMCIGGNKGPCNCKADTPSEEAAHTCQDVYSKGPCVTCEETWAHIQPPQADIDDAPRDGTRINITGIGEAWYEENLGCFMTMDADWDLIPVEIKQHDTWTLIIRTITRGEKNG